MLGPHSCQLQRDLRIRSGDNATGQERRAKKSFSNASFQKEKSHWVWVWGGGVHKEVSHRGVEAAPTAGKFGQTDC